jgi:drug/metabolite transporter (DMT)-like permease
MPIKDLLAVGISIFLNASAQICLRLGMRSTDVGALIAEQQYMALVKSVANVYVLCGLGCYGISVLTWMYVLSRTPVSVAYPMVSMVYIIVVFSGWFLLGEAFSWTRLIGVAVILCGVWLVARSA